jgi:hypothetical protein
MRWITPFPSCVVALAFYGVNEIGRCMEDPFSWDEPCHDLSGVGWRIYRENLQIHEKADEAEQEAADKAEMMRMTDANGGEHEQHDRDTGIRSNTQYAAAPTDNQPPVAAAAVAAAVAAGRRARSLSHAEKLRTALAAEPFARAAAHANAVEEAYALEDHAVTSSTAAAFNLPASPLHTLRKSRQRVSSSASVSGPISAAASAQVQLQQSAPASAADTPVAGTPRALHPEPKTLNRRPDSLNPSFKIINLIS